MSVPDTAVRPVRILAHGYEAPLAEPRRNAFGTMDRRPALFIEMEDASGAVGWGEVFCNWPVFGWRHRARIVADILAPLALDREHASPAAMMDALEDETRAITIQCDEPGPFAQAIAGLEIAAWNCVAARRNAPLHGVLAPDRTRAPVPAYASGLTAGTIDRIVPGLVGSGWSGFKLKIGFRNEADLAAVRRLRELAGPDAALMVDANQRFDREDAARMADALAIGGIAWFEEPIAADAPIEDWIWLAERSAIPLAGGENVRGMDAFEQLIDGDALAVVQPDIAKWGGLARAMHIAERAKARGVAFAPHYLGGAVGLAATAELAMATGASWLEVDANPNPLRDKPLTPDFIHNGRYVASEATAQFDPTAVANLLAATSEADNP